MSNDDSLTIIHSAQVAFFKEKLTKLNTIAEYDPMLLNGKSAIYTPALLLDAGEITPAGALTGNRTPLNINFAAHCFLSMKTKKVQLNVRNFAMKVVQLVYQNRWGLSHAGLPQNIYAMPASFSHKLGFESWVVTWDQEFHLAPINLDEELDWLPEKVWLGQAPNIGAAHVDDYKLIYNGADDE